MKAKVKQMVKMEMNKPFGAVFSLKSSKWPFSQKQFSILHFFFNIEGGAVDLTATESVPAKFSIKLHNFHTVGIPSYNKLHNFD